MDLSKLRQEYSRTILDVDSIDGDPVDQFETWFKQAQSAELVEPNAMSLATIDSSGQPTQRTVLLKHFDHDGFVFFTNYTSRKASHIAENARVSLLFQWLPLQRQIEISGIAEKAGDSISAEYFSKRPRGSQLGAWVSNQSKVIPNRKFLEDKLAELSERFTDQDIPLPEFWGGYRVCPDRFEFWQGGMDRLHDRIQYTRSDDAWKIERLSP